MRLVKISCSMEKNVLGRKNSAEHTFSVAGCRKASSFRKTQDFCKPPITPDPAETAELARTDRPPQTSARRP